SVLLLIGDGELKSEVEQQVAKLNLCDKVRLMGVLENVYDQINAFDVFIFPSTFEGLGIVSIEAQANALGVLQSDVIPQEVLISSKVISLPLSAPINEWTEAIGRLVKMERGIAEFSGNFSNYDSRTAAARLSEIYQSMEKEKKSAGR
ncbi:MAG: glycosyltransferase, partial [Firmicutes bacterium]|nr:glycosyltransferase [Bacillota bacterium]